MDVSTDERVGSASGAGRLLSRIVCVIVQLEHLLTSEGTIHGHGAVRSSAHLRPEATGRSRRRRSSRRRYVKGPDLMASGGVQPQIVAEFRVSCPLI